MQVTVKGFDNVFGIHVGNKPLTISNLKGIIHGLQKVKPKDIKDKYNLSPENYAFVDLASEEEEEKYLDEQTILKGGEQLGLRAINF